MWALLIAAGLSVVLAAAALTIYSAQQAPRALATIVPAFPFIFLFACLIINGFAWWKNIVDGGEQSRASNELGSDNEPV